MEIIIPNLPIWMYQLLYISHPLIILQIQQEPTLYVQRKNGQEWSGNSSASIWGANCTIPDIPLAAFPWLLMYTGLWI